jgi:gamma-D-glutamyl-L-lysine dipeptidyl-peptidase
MSGPRLERAVDDVRRRWVPDRRLGVFDVEIADARLSGGVSSRDALQALRRVAAEAGLGDELRLLPDESVGADAAAVVTAAIAPLQDQPTPRAARASECLHGEALTTLERRGDWLRVRAADGYHGWLHAGYARLGSADWAEDWTHRATGRSVGAELAVPEGRLRLPTGARAVLRPRGGVETADGRVGSVVRGDVRPEIEIRAEARLLAPPELGQRWFGGAPYLWGGRTEWGIDCSGFAQAVYAARGVALLRDSDQQVTQGREVALSAGGLGYEAGDLLFFAEEGKVSHVAMWLGAGRVVHAALSRGGVATDDLSADTPQARRLRDHLVAVRRVV